MSPKFVKGRTKYGRKNDIKFVRHFQKNGSVIGSYRVNVTVRFPIILGRTKGLWSTKNVNYKLWFYLKSATGNSKLAKHNKVRPWCVANNTG